MSALRGHLKDYLDMRHALGFKLERAGALLAQFVAFAEGEGADVLTVELALRVGSTSKRREAYLGGETPRGRAQLRWLSSRSSTRQTR